MSERRRYMSNSNTGNQLNNYDKIPVLYCRHCLSIKVRNIPVMEDSDYCDDCGSTDIGECSIKEWETLYKNRYGHKYLDSY